VELFVYVAMHMEEDARELPTILILGGDDADRERVCESWHDFDVEECQCHKEEDKTRMMAVIECNPGGVHHFNSYVKAVAASLLAKKSSSKLAQRTSTVSAKWSDFELVLHASMIGARSTAMSSASITVLEPTAITQNACRATSSASSAAIHVAELSVIPGSTMGLE
jgi:hypothetical protein